MFKRQQETFQKMMGGMRDVKSALLTKHKGSKGTKGKSSHHSHHGGGGGHHGTVANAGDFLGLGAHGGAMPGLAEADRVLGNMPGQGSLGALRLDQMGRAFGASDDCDDDDWRCLAMAQSFAAQPVASLGRGTEDEIALLRERLEAEQLHSAENQK
jgi:hypothetical protein